MKSALIVSYNAKSIHCFTEILSAASIEQIAVLRSCAEARRLLLERDFDLVLIDAPLRDESGETLSRHIAAKGVSQVILVVAGEHFDAVSSICENDGVLTIPRPAGKAVLWSALKLARAAQNRFAHAQAENSELRRKIEDIRIMDRAKCILISYLNMSEQEAHKYLEKQAMNMRTTKRTVAEGIVKTYEG